MPSFVSTRTPQPQKRKQKWNTSIYVFASPAPGRFASDLLAHAARLPLAVADAVGRARALRQRLLGVAAPNRLVRRMCVREFFEHQSRIDSRRRAPPHAGVIL